VICEERQEGSGPRIERRTRLMRLETYARSIIDEREKKIYVVSERDE